MRYVTLVCAAISASPAFASPAAPVEAPRPWRVFHDRYESARDDYTAAVRFVRSLGGSVVPDKWPFTSHTVVYLGGSKVNDENVGRLAGLRPHATYLELRGTPLTDAALPVLASFPRLELIDVRETRITPAGVSALRRSFPGKAVVYADH